MKIVLRPKYFNELILGFKYTLKTYKIQKFVTNFIKIKLGKQKTLDFIEKIDKMI